MLGENLRNLSLLKVSLPIGQKLYSLTREAFGQLLSLVQTWLATGQSCDKVLDILMPA